ncbi:putative ion transporter [Scheffersomyces amazonensis]|uniref:putative ion transporter n=1 Tax=Scheffersomyces amazonensis TaxID=1078765 RepID=UPI00315C89B2
MCFLGLAVGIPILQPTALKFGKRFVYLIGTVIVLAASIIGSQAKTVGSIDVYMLLGGIAAAPVDTLVEISSTDIFFQHERASAISWLIFALYSGSFLGPVAAGYITTSMGWKWCFYFEIIIFAVLLIIQLFYMEDTTFRRDFNEEELEENILKQIHLRDKTPIDTKSKDGAADEVKEVNSTSIAEEDIASIDESIPKRGYWSRMRLMEFEYGDLRSWLTIFIRPVYLITFPAVIWGGIIYGAQMMYLSVIGTSQAQIFSAAPYHFQANTIGLTNISVCVGNVIGMYYGGSFVDWSTVWLAKRNDGVLEPEFRLYSMLIPTVVNAAGLLAYGLGAHYGAHWAVPVIIGQGLLGVAMTSSGAICIAYAIDSYQMLASEALVVMLVLRNCIGMSFTFGFQPWLEASGLKLLTWLVFMLSIFINGSYILMIKYGKKLRKWTQKRYEKYSDPNFGESFLKKNVKESTP